MRTGAPRLPHSVGRLLRVLGLLSLLLAPAGIARADDAQWIWAPQASAESGPRTAYFRRVFELGRPESGAVEIAADERYELFVNGRSIGQGRNWRSLDNYDITTALVPGRNVIAVKVIKEADGPAGLVARVAVKQSGNTHVSHSTDDQWRASVAEQPHWQARLEAGEWADAKVLGALGETKPWGDEVGAGAAASRFKTMREFRVEPVLSSAQTGSLLAMTFDELGRIIASQENGPLVRASDANGDGKLDQVDVYCDLVKNCQGILCLGSHVLAVGDGPDGPGLYRLIDENKDDKPEQARTLIKFVGGMGEHGAHVPVLGPDGMVYVLVGNHAHPERAYDSTSPHKNFYEGDLIQPRYEDAGGHAVGIKAPGGVILRTDLEGKTLELHSGGYRNPYDFCFNRQGELFTFDSDMEWDLGLPWYKPTRLLHGTSGGEFGWRSGWATWPAHFLDALPASLDAGPGSPTGMTCYDHFMFPRRFQNSLFVCDWSRGRILNVRLERTDGSYKATSEVFVEGRPLNATDVEVGPDGAVYFATGGRGTQGGVYRVSWIGKVPAEVLNLGQGLTSALRQPQPNAAWSHHRIAATRREIGAAWDAQIAAAATNDELPVPLRAQALQLMQIFGPFPSAELLVRVSRHSSVELRTKAAYLLGLHAEAVGVERLVELLSDEDGTVRRQACESLARAGKPAPIGVLLPLLADPNRHVAFAARRLLEHQPRESWQAAVLEAPNLRTMIVGSLALVTSHADRETALAVLERAQQALGEDMSDSEFLDLLRVIEVALERGQIVAADVPELARALSDEYPAELPLGVPVSERLDYLMNRGLVRLNVYLQQSEALPRLLAQVKADIPLADKLHAALYARFLKAGWTPEQKLELLEFYETSRSLPGGHSFSGYIDNVNRDLVAGMEPEERALVLAAGAKLPTAALNVLATSKAAPSPETLAQLVQLDRSLAGATSEPAKRLSIGILATIASSGHEPALAHLREVFQRDPERRPVLSLALAIQPGGDNWPLLVQALPSLEGAPAQEVMTRLATVDRRPEGSEAVRQVILRGLKLGPAGGSAAFDLLERWTGEQNGAPQDAWDQNMARWQEWFGTMYPDAPEPKLPLETAANRWTLEELLNHVDGPSRAVGDAARGREVFAKAQCAKCHRVGADGEALGPDLTTLAQRFQKKEVLESVLFPSQVISDQYAATTLALEDGRVLLGIVAAAGEGRVAVLQTTGEKLVIDEALVVERRHSKTSAMPEGLFANLTLEEIADLLAYLLPAGPPPEVGAVPGGALR